MQAPIVLKITVDATPAVRTINRAIAQLDALREREPRARRRNF